MNGNNEKPPIPAAAAAALDHDTIDAMFAASGYSAADLDANLEAEHDVIGTRAVSYVQQQDPEAATAARKGFYDALAAIPLEEKKAYHEAMQQAPDVVEKESPPERFLLASNYDFWEAAQRFTVYWEKRRNLFGKERFCLPMNLSGKGALSPAEVEAIKCGPSVVCSPDKFNRAVLLFDREKAPDAFHNPDTRLKAYFYNLQVLSESDLTIMNGYVLLVAIESPEEKNKFQPDIRSELENFKSQPCPVKIRAMHVLALSPSFLQQALNLCLSVAKAWDFISVRTRTHRANNESELKRDLDVYGFSKQHIPERFGGTANFEQWYEGRLELERRRYQQPSAAALAAPDLAAAEREREQQLKRMIDHVHEYNQESMEKRKLAKIEKQASTLRKQNEALQRKHDFLEAQVTCAKHIAQEYDQDLQTIRMATAEFLATIPGTPPELAGDSRRRSELADEILTNLMLFAGRRPFTGEWMFVTPPGLPREKEVFSHGIQTCLLERQKQFLEQDEDLSDEEEAQGGTNTLGQEDGTSFDQQVSPMKQETPTRSRDKEGSTSGPAQEEDTLSVLNQESKLRARFVTLQQKHDSIKQAHILLASSLTCVRYLSDGLEEYIEHNRDSLAQHYAKVFTSLTGLSSETLQSPYTPQESADRNLRNHTAYDGSDFVNSTMHELESSKDGTMQLDVSSLDVESVLEITAAIFVGQPTPLSHIKQLQEKVEQDRNLLQAEAEERRRLEEVRQEVARRECQLKRRKLWKRL